MKYPSGVKKNNTNNVSSKKKNVKYGSRGMTLEKDIDLTNDYYREKGIAIIHKKPTPIQIVNVDYPARHKAKITEAYFKVPSTSDYNGIYKGRYIDFEAKETGNSSRFPFINIHEHQVNHMKDCYQTGGIVFLIIKFTIYDEIYLMPFDKFYKHWDLYINHNGRKSIKYDDIKQQSLIIETGINPRIDYIKKVEQYFLGGNNE